MSLIIARTCYIERDIEDNNMWNVKCITNNMDYTHNVDYDKSQCTSRTFGKSSQAPQLTRHLTSKTDATRLLKRGQCLAMAMPKWIDIQAIFYINQK